MSGGDGGGSGREEEDADPLSFSHILHTQIISHLSDINIISIKKYKYLYIKIFYIN